LQAALQLNASSVGAGWVVLDGIDRLLMITDDANLMVEQIAALNDWCASRGICVLMTGKNVEPGSVRRTYLEGIEFMLDTVLVLSTDLVERKLNRRFRIAKYRGSSHVTNELPVVMDDDGLKLPFGDLPETVSEASAERVGFGIPRLDRVLDGGVYRGSTTLISGEPGTAKTTLAAAFAAAAAERGERALYVSFDELADRIVRNVSGVGIDLQRHIDSGRLTVTSRDAWRNLVEEHYIAIQSMIEEMKPDCLVIDPVSALLKASSAEGAIVATERLLGSVRALGITTIITSLRDTELPGGESTLSHASTLADTWMVLSYDMRAGERNRSLSIVKSRGAAHSNQMRELVLSSDGVDLADVYQFGSEVLMGTARVDKVHEEEAERRREAEARCQRRRELEREIERAREQMRQADSEVQRLEIELQRETEEDEMQERDDMNRKEQVRRLRDGSPEPGRSGAGCGGEREGGDA
jgi:circadian clock protein KaiC